MQISQVDAIPLSIPFTHGGPSIAWVGNDWKALDVVLVRIETDEGLVGWGEAFSYNCRRAVTAMVEDVAGPLVLGKDVHDRAALVHSLQVQMHLWGRYGVSMFAISGIDIALWDLAGKIAGQPLGQLLGGGKTKLPAYASLLKYQDPEVVAERTGHALEQGYRLIKLHESTVQPVRAAREAAGDEVAIMLDVNCAWSPLEAVAIVPQLAEYRLHWLEEPVWPPENFQCLAELRDAYGVPTASGENACTAWQFQSMFDFNAVDYAQPSVTKVGGVSEFLKVAAIAETGNVAIAPHSPYFGPGFLASLHLLAATPDPFLIEHIYLDLEAYPFGDLNKPDGNAFRVPDGPGLGADPDPNVLQDYLVKDA